MSDIPTLSPSASAFPTFAGSDSGTGTPAPSVSLFPTPSATPFPTISPAPSASPAPTFADTVGGTPAPSASPAPTFAGTMGDTMADTVPTAVPEFPSRTETPTRKQDSPSTGGGKNPAKNFGWVAFAGVLLVALVFVWRGYACIRRRREQKIMDQRSEQADLVLGDMQMVPNQEMDLL
jgi:hypothetical protein